MKKYKCTICKYEYDPAQGDPTQGIAPGTPFEQLPADWKCPRCKQGKEKFEPIEEPKPANPYAGTQTEKNLHAAFAGESEARNKYTYFASKAKKEGFEQIAALFLQTAENEKEHAKLWFKELNGIGTTAENLAAAAAGENYEWTDMYEGFARTAEPPQARTTSGRTCTKALPAPPKPRASPSWPPNSVAWPPSRSTMRSVTAPCCTTSKPKKSLPRAK